MSMSVDEAVATRRSVRAFLPDPIDLDLLRDLIGQATRAASGGNLQPWHLHIVAGDGIERFRARMAERLAESPLGDEPEYPVYPRGLGEPYKARRFGIGEAMYARLGIPRDDKAARLEWFAKNYDFFGAPVALFCFVDRTHGPPQWSDCGMLLATLMLLLRGHGLDSCAQEAWTVHHRTVAEFLGEGPERMLFTGMAIGRRDPDAAINLFDVPRAPVDEVVRFHTA